MSLLKTPVRKDTAVGRFYEIDGARYPSVTHILGTIAKPALIPWAAKQERTLVSETAADLYVDVAGTPAMSRAAYLATLSARLGKARAHAKETDKACEIGGQAHALIEWETRRQMGQAVGPEPRVVEAAQWAFMAWQDWARAVALKPILVEQCVYSHAHGYAGTMDLLAEVSGVLTLVDYKTSKSVYAESYLQNIAYRQALDEMGHPAAEAGLIVRLPKLTTDPAFEAVPVPDDPTLLPTFLALIPVWRWAHAQEAAYQAKRTAA